MKLALSTSAPAASAALTDGGRILDSIVCRANEPHSVTALPAVEALLKRNGLKPCELDGFIVDVGPGSFTGVRIGVSAVNAMAFALDKPVYPVSSLAALAYGHCGVCCSVLDARNGNCYAAVYSDGVEVLAPFATDYEKLLTLTPANTLFAGDGAVKYRELIEARALGAVFTDLNDVLADRLALCAGEAVSEASPIYLRPSQAERNKTHE